jgi:hypothetical protein
MTPSMKKIFNYIYTSLSSQTFYYDVKEEKNKIIDQLNYLFNERKGLFKSPNLTGSFVDDNSFTMVPKWTLGYVKGFGNNSVRLKGILTESAISETRIEISVRPNFVFAFFAILMGIAGVLALFNAIRVGDYAPKTLAGGVLGFLLFEAVFISQARMLTYNLRRSFEKYMQISPNNSEKKPD